MNKTIFVKRETYEKDGKVRFTYFVEGNVRGQYVKASVVPHDFGGYGVLDIVFNGAMEAELITKNFEMKDEKGKVTGTVTTYAVISKDEDGTTYECAVKPNRKSDNDYLNMLVR